jgi:hypothetical protein
MSNYPDPQSNFLVIGIVVRDPMLGPNYVLISVRDGEKLYLDVAVFEDGPLAEARNLKGGMQVKIAGVLGKRKMKGVVDLKGRQVYETTLLARRIAIIGAPSYQMPQQPMYVPANPPGAPAMTYPQWVAQQGPPNQIANPQYAHPPSPPQPAPTSHPASWDLDDKLAF